MGTFEKVYEVDGQSYELYVQEIDGERSYQLVNKASEPIGEPFADIPSDEAVAALVATPLSDAA
jgi:hypothetical protein